MVCSAGGRLLCFLCTRNRSSELECCLKSLAHACLTAFPGEQIPCFIFDDSTIVAHSVAIASFCQSQPFDALHLSYIRTEEDLAPLFSLTSASSIQRLRVSCKRLGSGPWDLAGTRNLAFLYALTCSRDEDILLFLDDDILLESAWYAGHWITVHGAVVLRQLREQTLPCIMNASGVGRYYGGHDTSLRQHLAFALTDLWQVLAVEELAGEEQGSLQRLFADISRFPQALPLRLNLPDNHLAEGGPGLSGAVLATTPTTLRSHGLPRWYNEDWTWLSLLDPLSLHRVGSPVLHAAPSQTPITHDFFCYQLHGDLLYTALTYALQTSIPGMSRLASCRQILSTQHFTRALHEYKRAILLEQQLLQRCSALAKETWSHQLSIEAMLVGLKAIASYLENALAFVETLDPCRLQEEVQRYFAFTAFWRATLH